MTVAQKKVTVFLSDDGREVLRQADCDPPATGGMFMYVQELDDWGLWVRIEREDADHIVLVRWEHVLTLDFQAEPAKPMGMRR